MKTLTPGEKHFSLSEEIHFIEIICYETQGK